MRKSILTFGLTVVLASVSLAGFAQENKKAKSARKEMKCAKKNLSEAKKDSVAEFAEFRKEAEIKIADNQAKIAELKTKKREDNKDTQEAYDKKVLALEQKNNDLRIKMAGASDAKPSAWASYKREFSHDMEEFGKAFKSIGQNNVK